MSGPAQYVSKKEVAASYRPKSHQMSPGLLRARAPFKVRNAITGVTIAALVVGVWAYSIAAVKQDSFADVDEEAKILAASGPTHNIKSIEDEEKVKAAATIHPPSATVTPVVAPLPELASRPKGVLSPLLEKYYPRLLDPTSKTFIWGAPPVDRVGHLRDRTNGRPASGAGA